MAPPPAQPVAQSATSAQQEWAATLLETEKFRAKLVPFRIVGAILGLAIGIAAWQISQNFYVGVVGLLGLPFVGIWVGNLVGLSRIRG
jgi:LytS/YehU family sensor histidine kinase